MKIKVNQTAAGRHSQYEVLVNDQPKYTVGDTETNIVVPVRVFGESGADVGFGDSNRMVEAAASYSFCMVENNADPETGEAKFFGVKQKGSKGSVYDSKGGKIARFHRVKDEALKANFVIEYDGYSYDCYDKSSGKVRNISVYKNDVQIAAIVKPLHTVDNLDEYYIFLLDEYSGLESIIALFTLFYDLRYYSNRNEKTKGQKVYVEYTFDKNERRYNKNWIADNFGRETAEAMEEEMLQKRAVAKKGIKKRAAIIGLSILLGWIILFIVLGIINNYYGGIF